MASAVGVFFICSFVTSSLAVTSYLDWPRIHFNGTFLSDVTTVNNIRCNFMNEKFTATNLEQAFPVLREINRSNTPTAYENFVAGWNPDGSFHFKFIDAVVRSFCGNSVKCSTDDGIVGRTVSTLPYGVLVDLDTDWQVTASKLYAFKIQIGGYLEGDMKPAEIALPSPSRRTVIKSALENITWHDTDYRSLFNDAKELSISMTIDQYSKVTHLGRVTGTIGLTSAGDPLTTTAYRALYPVDAKWVKEVGRSPFDLKMADKLLVIDLSWGIPSDDQGLFLSKNLGMLELVITSRSTKCGLNCIETEMERIVNENKTVIGSVSIPLGNDNQWYDDYGGVLTLDLSEFSIENSAFEVKQELPGQESKIVLSELPFGVNIAVMEDKTVRLNVGESFVWNVFVSSYGSPVENADVSLNLGPYLATYDCAIAGCNRTLGWPKESLLVDCIGSPRHCAAGVGAKTDQFGFATFELTAQSDPGNPRGCGLDGQVYPMAVRARIPSCDVYFADGGLIINTTDYWMNTMPLAVMIFSEFPVTSDPPTWQDVKGIFQQYHNLYPVMWKNRIVDLGTYEGVKEKIAVVSRSMRLPVNDPRFMPISRDLSRSKRDVIFRWIASGLPRYPENNANAPSQKCVDTTQELKDLLQVAASLELSTIPPYYTAWLSLQTEHGKNLQIADLIKSVYIEEMYHLAFASNILSAIRGQVKLTDFSNVPVYPTVLGFGSVYELARDITVTLKRFSIGLVADIFSGIEKPQDGEQSRIFKVVATLANLTHNPDLIFSENVIDFLESFQEDSGCESLRNSGSIDWNCINNYSLQALSWLHSTNITTIGSFYSYVALQLAFLESCAQTGQIAGINSTIFKSSRQISYPGLLLEVKDLSTALSAIIEIVHEGEGGSECHPDVSDTSSELSHYYRFQEIVYGRKLERVSDANYDNKTYACLDLPKACKQSSAFCYNGDPLPFYESGVWPIVANAKAPNYEQGSEAKLLNNDFNSVYTGILHCIDDIYENKATMFQCVTIMRDLAIAGKKLVATSVDNGVYKGKNAAPTWSFLLRQDERAGLPLVLPNQPDFESTCVDNGSVASGNTMNPLQLNLLGLMLIIVLVFRGM